MDWPFQEVFKNRITAYQYHIVKRGGPIAFLPVLLLSFPDHKTLLLMELSLSLISHSGCQPRSRGQAAQDQQGPHFSSRGLPAGLTLSLLSQTKLCVLLLTEVGK